MADKRKQVSFDTQCISLYNIKIILGKKATTTNYYISIEFIIFYLLIQKETKRARSNEFSSSKLAENDI